MNEEYDNNQVNDQMSNQVNNQAGDVNQQTSNTQPEDTTYHRSYIGENDPNMRTYVGANQGQANANQHQQNAQPNNQQSAQQNTQGPRPFYANYDPNGGNANYTYYQNSTTAPQNNGYQYNNQKVKVKKEKKPHPTLKFIGKAAAFGLIAGTIMVGMIFGYNKLNGNNKVGTTNTTQSVSKDTGTVKTTKGSSSATTSDIAKIVENDMPSIVTITSTFDASRGNNFSDFYYWFYGGNSDDNSDKVGSGSGVIISETDKQLMIVTNNHVISDSTYGDAVKVKVTFSDDKAVDAVVKGTDSDADLAVLTVNKSDMESSTLDTVKIAVLGDSDEMKVGDQVVAIGNALGYGQSVTSGIVSALDRVVQLEDKSMTLLQTDAAINPGNSGGALLNMKGELIGINSVKYASSEVEGMGYAIPMATAEPIINDLMNSEEVSENEAGYLGVYGSDVSAKVAANYGMPEGVWITKLSDDSPAEKAGIQQKDIITKIDSRKITAMSTLQEVIAKKKAGTEVTVTVMRQNESGEYKEVEIKVTLGKRPESLNKSSQNGNGNNSGSDDQNQESEQQNPYGDEEQMDPFEYFFGN